MKKRITLATAFLFACSAFLFGQNTFERTYGELAAYDEAHSIVRTDEGSFYTLGTRFNHDNGSLDLLLSALDMQGNELWSKTYGGDENEEGRKLLLLEDGLLLLGYTKSFGEGGRDWYVVKTDFEGTTVWSQTYGGPDRDEGLDAALGANGDILLAGFRETGALSGSDIWLAVIDGEGNLQSDTYLLTENRDNFFCAGATADGGWLIGWETGTNEKLTKLSPDLQANIWELEDDAFSSFFTAFSDIQQLENGDLLVSGYGTYPWVAQVSNAGFVIRENLIEEGASGLPLNNYQAVGSVAVAENLFYLLARPTDLSGPGAVLAIYRDFLDLSGLYFFDEQMPKPNDMIVPEPAESVYVTGTASTANGGRDVFLLKGFITGETDWRTTFGQEGAVGEEFGFRVLEAEDGSFYLVNGSRSANFDYFKATFIKVDGAGNPLWTLEYGLDTHENQITDMALLANGNLAVLGAHLPGLVPNPPPYSLFLLQISPEGQLVSEITIPAYSVFPSGGIAALPGGGFITAIRISPDQDSGEGLYLTRWDETGSMMWEQLYNIRDENLIRPYDLAYSSFDQTVVCAATFEIDSPALQDGVVKFDIENGAIIWAAAAELAEGLFSYIQAGPDGAIAASGLFIDFSTSPISFNSQAYWLDASGTELGYQQYSKEGYNYVAFNSGLHFLPDGRFWTVGYQYAIAPLPNYNSPPSTETVQGLMTFYDGQGNLAQELIFGDEAYPILLSDGSPTSDGGFVAIGNKYLGAFMNRDIYLLKTDAQGLVSTRFAIRREGKLTLSPNPSDGRLRFSFQSAAMGEMTAELHDMQGRRLWHSAFDKLDETAGRELDFSTLPNGSYVFSVAMDGQRYGGQWVKGSE